MPLAGHTPCRLLRPPDLCADAEGVRRWSSSSTLTCARSDVALSPCCYATPFLQSLVMTLALPIQTERLVLRCLQLSDLEHFAACRADPVLARYQGWSPMSQDEARMFVTDMLAQPTLEAGTWHQIAIASRVGDVLLGDIGLCVRENGEAEIEFTLAHDAQGKGFATEALQALTRALFDHPEVMRIVGETDERNRASVRVLERLGMKLVSKHDAIFKQEPCVELRYEFSRGTRSGV
jgi:RimJ/RimL family protein N-acetyltransferase